MRKIKGIVLAGGMGTRLYPLTKVTNKHLLPLGGEPMIYHPIRKLVEAGINDIMIVTGVEHCGSIMTLLGSGTDHGCSFTYKVQDRPDGIAGALRLCRGFVNDDACAVILGDNIFKDNLKSYVEDFCSGTSECKLFFKRVPDPRRYGVGVFDEDKLIRVEEKPLRPETNLACVGIYFYTSEVFDVIDKSKMSERGEYEISTVNNAFIDASTCNYEVLEERWADAGTMDSYHNTNQLIYREK
jgi:glucose-1-phosphate thymidylyltransferase